MPRYWSNPEIEGLFGMNSVKTCTKSVLLVMQQLRCIQKSERN